MKSKAQKQEAIDRLEKALPGASITIFTTFSRAGEQGLSVAQMQELKRSLRDSESEYVVTKKTLLTKALEDLKYDGIDAYGMDGSIGLVIGHGDIYAVAKAAHQFAKANPALKLFAAWSDGHVMTTEEVTEIAIMPSKDELIVRLMGMLTYPLKSLAIVLNQIAEARPAEVAPAAPEETTEEPKADTEPTADPDSGEAVATPSE
jgi:large subunit ribosomal protein L10